MMRTKELTLPVEREALEAFRRFTRRLVEAFPLRAPADAVRNAVEIAGAAFAGDASAWPALVRTIADLLAITAGHDGGAVDDLRAFVEENADLL